MVLAIGRNLNTNDTAVVSTGTTMTVGTTAETVLPANSSRIYMAISVSGHDAFIRLQDAATDPTIKKGIIVPKGGTYELPPDNMYTGEISIITVLGATAPTYFATEF